MKLKHWILLFLSLIFIGCNCKKTILDKSRNTEESLQENILKKDTLYIVFDNKNFEKKEDKIKPHLKLDSVPMIEFLLKREGEDISWSYMESIPHFENDSTFLKPTNALSLKKVKSLPLDRIIPTSQLLEIGNQDLYENLRNKDLFILDNGRSCNFKVYRVQFSTGFKFFGGIE